VRVAQKTARYLCQDGHNPTQYALIAQGLNYVLTKYGKRTVAT
jgi:hypothetical protein